MREMKTRCQPEPVWSYCRTAISRHSSSPYCVTHARRCKPCGFRTSHDGVVSNRPGHCPSTAPIAPATKGPVCARPASHPAEPPCSLASALREIRCEIADLKRNLSSALEISALLTSAITIEQDYSGAVTGLLFPRPLTVQGAVRVHGNLSLKGCVIVN